MKSFMAGMVVLGSGCVLSTGFQGLPENERDAYESCLPHVAAHSCPEHDKIQCMLTVERNYARLSTRDERQSYLVQAGCPDVLVSAVLSGRTRPVEPDDARPWPQAKEFKPAGAP